VPVLGVVLVATGAWAVFKLWTFALFLFPIIVSMP